MRRADSGGRDVEFIQLSVGLRDPAAKPMGAPELSTTEAWAWQGIILMCQPLSGVDMDHIKERMSCPVHLHSIHCELHGPACPEGVKVEWETRWSTGLQIN